MIATRSLRSTAVAFAAVLGLSIGVSPVSAEGNSEGAGASALTSTTPLVGAGWQLFGWVGDGLSQETFRIVTKRKVRVTVTDAFCAGDAFKVRSKGKLLAVTPRVAPDPGCVTDVGDPDQALADPGFSHRSFVLKPGRYAIRLKAYQNPFGTGAAFIRFDRCRPGAR